MERYEPFQGIPQKIFSINYLPNIAAELDSAPRKGEGVGGCIIRIDNRLNSYKMGKIASKTQALRLTSRTILHHSDAL